MIVDKHIPVMLEQVLTNLVLDPEGKYVDCTFGRGGHSREILSCLGANGRLLGLDKDIEAVNSQVAKMLLADRKFDIEHVDFSTLDSSVTQRGWFGKISGVLMDLGVSSPQLDQAERGFSFLKDGPLDMRMDTTGGESAAEWIAQVSQQELESVLRRFGEEKFARRIARAVIDTRKTQSIDSTKQLAELIAQTLPVREKNKHPATRSFQAIRIFVNRELEKLQAALSQALSVLKPNGRLVVISFHSLEDRIVKRFMRDQSRGGSFPPGLPVPDSAFIPRLITIGKPLKPNATEIACNPRARSAVLRVAEKLG